VIHFFAGARPNFVKIAPVFHAYEGPKRFIHSGQHYDSILSSSFIQALKLPVYSNLGMLRQHATHAEQVAWLMVKAEALLARERPDAVVVPGDVNASLGVALAAGKLNIPIIHLEAGLRSGDMTMPEEQNRKLIDHLSALCLATCNDANFNLRAEGIRESRIRQPGNTMIDTLLKHMPRANDLQYPRAAEKYVLVTLHRPSLVDNPEALAAVMAVLEETAQHLPVLFPAHPRTLAQLGGQREGRVRVVPASGYLRFISQMQQATLVITDSGGVQEETTALKVPCLTYRNTTERPVTCRHGTNTLVGTEPQALMLAIQKTLMTPPKKLSPIWGWDGHAGPRAATSIYEFVETL
jgi:UDP-N-acetylglucosamine 2-epimerase (non-hydrolysing)